LRQALFQQPEFCLARFRLGKVYFSKKDYRRASQELKKAVEQEKCPIQDAFQLLGTMYLRLGQAESARESFARCVELNPRSCVAGECRRYAKSMDGRALQ
jgi:Tfp pilus assembly protein PilF